MSGLQFIVDFAEALAWPLAVVAVVVILRRPITEILRQLAGGLRRLRSGQADVEFERVVGQARAELTASVSGGPDPAGIPVQLQYATLAADDPPAAFAQAFGAVEAGLRELLTASGKLTPTGSGDPTAVARFARDQGLAAESLVRAVDCVVTLRNFAAADPARATRDHAAQYLALIDTVLFAIARQQSRYAAARSPVA